MSKLFLRSAVAALAFALPSAALACDGETKGQQANACENPPCDHAKARQASARPEVKTVTVAQVADWQKARKATILDANNAETRTRFGTIPGAVLLTSYKDYDAARELPAAKDQKLVFYCANTHCPASHAAAERALTRGYTDVSVLPDGIMGWKSAGQPTAAVPRS